MQIQVKRRKKHHGGFIFREGDSVMQMKNNYDIEWEQDGEVGTRNLQWRNGSNRKH